MRKSLLVEALRFRLRQVKKAKKADYCSMVNEATCVLCRQYSTFACQNPKGEECPAFPKICDAYGHLIGKWESGDVSKAEVVAWLEKQISEATK
jgi:hypothetical protein